MAGEKGSLTELHCAIRLKWSVQRFGLVLVPTNGIPVPGDANADGSVDQNEFEAVVKKYFQQHPPAMEGVTGPTGTLFNFGLPGLSALNFGVGTTNVTTPLNQWEPVGAACGHELSSPVLSTIAAAVGEIIAMRIVCSGQRARRRRSYADWIGPLRSNY